MIDSANLSRSEDARPANRPISVPLVVAGAVAAAYLIWSLADRIPRPTDLKPVALKIHEALAKQDVETLLKYAPDREKDLLKLDPGSMRRLLAVLGGSPLNHVREAGEVTNDNPALGTVSVTKLYRTQSGVVVPIEVIVHETPEGPRSYISGNLVLGSLVTRSVSPKDGSREDLRVWRAIGREVSASRKELEATGVPGVMDGGADATLLTWETLAKMSDSVMASGR